ncbi:green fluorescent seed 9, TRANSPARENT TESTA 9 [Hibiscus trionum]|uniref:Green fluorescent seed 9, TRANSPARENT TESTA 9 n=1 Tax=Hibiscus trionum TaxID=183268 RepID=A0A9W7IKN6_HIBTR|nr:green fluorescent seed 9, TRANSPARENT TESTA 9 [Hibiscus trionum]
MWRLLWRSIDRFSLQYFKSVITELRQIKVVDERNRDAVVDLLQSIVEIVTYGDRQDPLIFECFMECQVLAEFVRVLKISTSSTIEAPLLQYLSIMIQNMDNEHAIYYCLSNDYINNIVEHQYNFDAGDLALYYVSFLRAVSSKISRDTLCLLVKVNGDVVVSFPMYSEALKFAQHEEKMIQTAIRALTLNIYNICDDNVYQFITTPPASIYFSDLVYSLREQCLQLDALVHSTEEKCTSTKNKDIFLKTDEIIDNLYYFKDVLSVGESRLSGVVTQNLLSALISPLLLPLLKLGENKGSYNISAVTSFYVVSRLLQVVGGKHVINGVAGLLLYHYTVLCQRDAIVTNGDTAGGTGDGSPLLHFLNDTRIKISGPEAGGEEEININYLLQHLNEHTSSNSHYDGTPRDHNVHVERFGIFTYLFSDNHSISLASLFLLLTLAENKDLEHYPASLLRMNRSQGLTKCESAFAKVDGSILVRFMPQILKALLKVLACQPPVSPPIQWHTGWFLRKLLQCEGNTLTDDNVHLFNTSYEQSRECLRKELDGCWFDHIPDTIGHEWGSCKEALELQSQVKDPLFTLEIAICQQTIDGSSNSYFAWQRMVEAVKGFILHIQLKAFIFKGCLLEKPSLKSWSNSDLGKSSSRDTSSASFGSEVSLGSGIPCRIAFSYAGVRDVYLVAVACGISGKLILAEKHPFRSQRGVVIAIAPVAGLSPKIDEDHPTWLHLRIRDFDPNFFKAKGNQSKVSDPPADGRWTLGFHSAKACETAQLLILEETCKQRSSVERMLAPLLQEDYLGNILDGQGD